MADADEEDDPSALALLPHAVVLSIFAQLPVDLRARCACVCRGWRAALCERALWTRLDVSGTSGVAAVTDALLRGAAARAGGALEALDASGSFDVSREALLEVAAANGGALRQLRMRHGVCHSGRLHANLLQLGDAQALLRAAPLLQLLDADVSCDTVADAQILLRSEGLLAPLRVRGLRVHIGGVAEAEVLALVADMASHAWLQHLCLLGAAQTRAALDAVLDVALARRFQALQCVQCGLCAATAPALARQLRGGAVSELIVWGYGDGTELLDDAPAAALLAEALRANATLTSLQLGSVGLWYDVAAARVLLGALAEHPRLRVLQLPGNMVNDGAADRGAAGAALAALLAANAPALTELDVSYCNLGEAGLRPLLAALPANTHLRTLNCASNDITEAFAADVLLPAVRASGSLRALAWGRGFSWPAEREAADVVNGRAAAHR
jgi:hypothetical protein